MKPLRVYVYKNCDTCRKALKYLDARGVEYVAVPIRETPPAKTELLRALKQFNGDVRRVFNTSGGDYKALNLKERMAAMTRDEAVELLAANGNLVKRPFLIGPDVILVGFGEEEWDQAL